MNYLWNEASREEGVHASTPCIHILHSIDLGRPVCELAFFVRFSLFFSSLSLSFVVSFFKSLFFNFFSLFLIMFLFFIFCILSFFFSISYSFFHFSFWFLLSFHFWFFSFFQCFLFTFPVICFFFLFRFPSSLLSLSLSFVLQFVLSLCIYHFFSSLSLSPFLPFLSLFCFFLSPLPWPSTARECWCPWCQVCSPQPIVIDIKVTLRLWGAGHWAIKLGVEWVWRTPRTINYRLLTLKCDYVPIEAAPSGTRNKGIRSYGRY